MAVGGAPSFTKCGWLLAPLVKQRGVGAARERGLTATRPRVSGSVPLFDQEEQTRLPVVRCREGHDPMADQSQS